MKLPANLFLLTLPLFCANVKANDSPIDSTQLKRLLQCRQEAAPLLRLDCYDQALNPGVAPPVDQAAVLAARTWQRAMEHEGQRRDHSNGLLLTNSGGENPRVILTAPALGLPPPRPILMISCIDNITRLQVALTTPLQGMTEAVTLTLQTDRFTSSWFIREKGYLLESSRGLAGIEEIKRLFGNTSLTLTIAQPPLKLVFNITGLSQTIKPLRKACHW